jgi:hypothetical protein
MSMHSSSWHFMELSCHFTLRPSYSPENGFSVPTVKACLIVNQDGVHRKNPFSGPKFNPSQPFSSIKANNLYVNFHAQICNLFTSTLLKSPSRNVNSREISRLLCNFHVQTDHIFTPSFFMIQFSNILPLTPTSTKWFLLFSFSNQNCV